MASTLSAAPVLSTENERALFEDPTPVVANYKRIERTDDELANVYEITRTAAEIQKRGWRRVALQFPDAMLGDAPWVVSALNKEFDKEEDSEASEPKRRRLYILADTSYSSCCVDEIAAEHVDADSVVHYGRACLSPTARLPVLHIFTKQDLDYDAVVDAFSNEFPDKGVKAVVMADVMFQDHVAPVCEFLKERGYTSVFATDIIRDPSSTIPNRSVASIEPITAGLHDYDLHDFHLFHISSPPTSLLLSLSSRLSSLRIYPTPSSPYSTSPHIAADPSTTPSMLRRRYGLVLRLATASIIGILVNTLSVKNYMSTISSLREQIAAAGKKSYTIVVGKLNAAKLANFAEVDGWVVVGCWESGLVDQEGLYRPVITPFELALALQGDETRVWTGEWWGGIEGVGVKGQEEGEGEGEGEIAGDREEEEEEVEGGVSDEESEPPVFDLRTGKLVSNSRPMMRHRVPIRTKPTTTSLDGTTAESSSSSSAALIKKNTAGAIALINGVASPGAEFLRSQRTWQGLGSDFNNEGDGDGEGPSTLVEEGRSGIARGYTVGEEGGRT
ncbi:diphthamide biosynthesis protein-like protein [Xylariaceae sp. FL0594]|nr:diphthamide biosynthesis protein-like protein [Xylariaceae sp. FL0594]